MAQERLDLLALEAAGVLDVVGQVSLEQQQGVGSVRLQSQFRKEVGIAGRHQRVEHEEPGSSVVRMEPVPAPRIVSHQCGGAQLSDDPGDIATLVHLVDEFAVHPTKVEHPVADTIPIHDARCAHRTVDHRCRRPALRFAGRHQGAEIGVRVPAALGSVGEDQVVHPASGRRPLGQRGATSELDVVGVRADGQGGGWDRLVDGDRRRSEQVSHWQSAGTVYTVYRF